MTCLCLATGSDGGTFGLDAREVGATSASGVSLTKSDIWA